jgi:hypothetical protein
MGLLDLLLSGAIDIVDLVRPESLEVVGHVPVRSESTSAGLSIFSHDVAGEGVGDLELILLLLVLSPLLLLPPLLLGHLFVELSQLLQLLLFLHAHLVLHHPSHPVQGQSLLRKTLLGLTLELIVGILLR